MSGHLTDRQLIDHRFDLAAEAESARTAEHLASCPECRARLEAIARRLSSLEALKEDVPASRELVAATLDRARTVSPVRPGRLRRWLVAGVAAAAAVALFVYAPRPKKKPVGHETPPDLVELRKSPPFAPASAIELNVLPRRESVQITIYNSADLTLVRETRNLTLKRGWNWLQFMWANTLIDPTSLHLQPLAHRDKIDVLALVFPPRIRQLGRWQIFSEVSGAVPVEITYLTSGLAWRAFYMGTMSPNEKTMRLQGYVRVANGSGEDYEEAQTRLIVGKVNVLDRIADLARRKHAYGSPVQAPDTYLTSNGSLQFGDEVQLLDRLSGIKKDLDRSDLGRKEIKKEGLSEYFLYTIEGTETIPNGWGKRLPSFEVEGIPIVSLYKYDEDRWGRQAVRFVAFANDEKHELGETPIPNGRVRTYRQVDVEKHLAYVGGADVKYIPVDEKVELNLGPARQVSVEPKVMDFRTENHDFNRHGGLTGWDEVRAWRLELKNTREIPAKIEITRGFGTAHWKLEGRAPAGYEKHDATHARFTVTLPPRSRKDIRYTLRTLHGTRENKM